MCRNKLYFETQTKNAQRIRYCDVPSHSAQLNLRNSLHTDPSRCKTRHVAHMPTTRTPDPTRCKKPCSGKLQSLTVKSGQQSPRCIWQVCKRLAPCVCRKPHGGCALTQPGRWWQLIHGTRMPGHELSQCNSCTAKIVLRFLEGRG